jgi:hypothetical protein
MPIGRELADGWCVIVMDAREEISSIHWAVAIWQFNTRLCQRAFLHRVPTLLIYLTLLSWGWTSDGRVTSPPQKYLSMGAKTISIRHILVAHHAGLPSRSR